MQFIDLKTQYQTLKTAIDARIAAVLAHGGYIMGPEVAELEQGLARYCGARHAIAVSSGTDALLMIMMALDIKPGDEVITTPFSFIATAETIALLGARPVFVDIDPVTYTLNPALIEAAITSRTKLIIPVSLYGQCADMEAIKAIAAAHRIPVMEDAAQSFGATRNKAHSCAISELAATSFYPAKPLGCYGDGGACFTDNDELALRIRQIRDHGQERRYYHVRLGINGRMDTIQAAVLLAKLEVYGEECASRERVAATYRRLLAERCPQITAPQLAPGNTSVYAQYTVRVPQREAVQAKLQAVGIPTAVHYPTPLHLQPVFANAEFPEGSMPHAERAAREVMSLPMHPYLTEGEIGAVVEGLATVLGELKSA